MALTRVDVTPQLLKERACYCGKCTTDTLRHRDGPIRVTRVIKRVLLLEGGVAIHRHSFPTRRSSDLHGSQAVLDFSSAGAIALASKLALTSPSLFSVSLCL